jgi:hypothetical protein
MNATLNRDRAARRHFLKEAFKAGEPDSAASIIAAARDDHGWTVQAATDVGFAVEYYGNGVRVWVPTYDGADDLIPF